MSSHETHAFCQFFFGGRVTRIAHDKEAHLPRVESVHPCRLSRNSRKPSDAIALHSNPPRISWTPALKACHELSLCNRINHRKVSSESIRGKLRGAVVPRGNPGQLDCVKLAVEAVRFGVVVPSDGKCVRRRLKRSGGGDRCCC